MTVLGARYPPGPVLEQLTARNPGVRHPLHRASAQMDQLTGEVLDLALEPLRVLYPQAHIPRPTGSPAWAYSTASGPFTRGAWWNNG